MKKIVVILMGLIILTGCKESKKILFCEGLSPEGEGVNCGVKFGTGDLTALIMGDETFEVSKILVEMFEINSKKEVKIETLTVEVKPDAKRATTTLSFYSGGTYKVKASKNGKYFADGDIEVVDD